jgi:hypothetical protein
LLEDDGSMLDSPRFKQGCSRHPPFGTHIFLLTRRFNSLK